MKKVIVLLIVSFCFSNYTYYIAEPMAEVSNTAVHETWRVKFNCDSACENKKDCGLVINKEKEESFSVDCSCGNCDVNALITVGNPSDNTIITQAKSSLAKNVLWKMMQVELKQKHADAKFQVTSVEVALNHGKVIVFFNYQLLDQENELTIQIVDMFN